MTTIVLRATMPVYVTVDPAQRTVVRVERSENETELDRAGEAPVVVDGEGDAHDAAAIAGCTEWPPSKLI